MSVASSIFKVVKWIVFVVVGSVATALITLFVYSKYVICIADAARSEIRIISAQTDWLMGVDDHDFYDNGKFVRLSTGPFGDSYQVGTYIIYDDTLVVTGYTIDEGGIKSPAYIVSDSCRWLIEAEKMNGIWVEKMNGYSSSIYDCNLNDQ